MASELSGRKFGWRLVWRVLLFLILMFGVPLVIYGLDRFFGDPEVTLTDAVRVTTGTIAGAYIYLLFVLLLVRPCWLRLGALGVPVGFSLFVPVLILLDLPYFLAANSTGMFGLSIGWPDAEVPVYLLTGLGLAATMIFAQPKPNVLLASQRWLGGAMLIINVVILGGYAFIFAMAYWLHVVEETLSSEDAPHPAFVPLVLASGRFTEISPMLCAALFGSAVLWTIVSRRASAGAGLATVTSPVARRPGTLE